MKIDSDFKLIETPNNGGSHYFVMVTLFTMQTTTIMSL